MWCSFMCLGVLSTLLSPTLCVAPGMNKALKDAEDESYGKIDGLNPKQQQDRKFFRYILRLSIVLQKVRRNIIKITKYNIMGGAAKMYRV